jgi:formylglycine-generating enzyme required for sulfatase activity
MSGRELMGLPEKYIELRNPAHHVIAMTLAGLSTRDLVAVIQDAERPAAVRLAAGQMLAILGDPRLDVLNPDMRLIKGGEVQIGLDEGDLPSVMSSLAGLGVDPDWIRKEIPRHTVTLGDYWIGTYLVTNLDYRAYLLDSGDTEIPSTWRFGQFPYAEGNCPVHTITGEAAQRYCLWLSQKTGRSFRLPTEAEWEFAAAGPDGLEFPWGNTLKPDHANIAEEGYLRVTPVGCFPAGQSWCGALDMAGNVEEYTSDLSGPYPGATEIIDDLRTTLDVYQIARGGSYTRFFDLARTRRRHGHYQKEIYVMGFRIAEDVNSYHCESTV